MTMLLKLWIGLLMQEHADKLTMDSGVKGLYVHAVEVVNSFIKSSSPPIYSSAIYKWVYNIDITGINERADKLTLVSEVKGCTMLKLWIELNY